MSPLFAGTDLLMGQAVSYAMAEPVDDHFGPPARFVTERRAALLDFLARGHAAGLPPAPCHASLREGEGEKDADRIERDQAGDAGLEDDDQQAGDQRQGHDAA